MTSHQQQQSNSSNNNKSVTMSLNSHQQQNRQRERERNQRERHNAVPTDPGSLFADPVKNRHEDETTRKIKSTLGDFEQVQRLLLNDHKPLIGISTREMSRIRGNKAKIDQILSEMRPFTPITGLDEVDDSIEVEDNSRNRSQTIQPASRDDLSLSGLSDDEEEDTGRHKSRTPVRHPAGDSNNFSPVRRDAPLTNGFAGRKAASPSPVHKSPASSSSSASSSESDSDSSSGSSSDDMSGDEEGELVPRSAPARDTPAAGDQVNDQPEAPVSKSEPESESVCWNLVSFVNKSSLPQRQRTDQENDAVISDKGDNSVNQIIDQVARGTGSSSGSSKQKYISELSSSSSSSPPSLSPETPPPAPLAVLHSKRKTMNSCSTYLDDDPKSKHFKPGPDTTSRTVTPSPTKTRDRVVAEEKVQRVSDPVSSRKCATSSSSSSLSGKVISCSTSSSNGNRTITSHSERKVRDSKELTPSRVRDEKPFANSNSNSNNSNKNEKSSRINHKENFDEFAKVFPPDPPEIICSISLDLLKRIPKPPFKEGHCKELTNVTPSDKVSVKSNSMSKSKVHNSKLDSGENKPKSRFTSVPTPPLSGSKKPLESKPYSSSKDPPSNSRIKSDIGSEKSSPSGHQQSLSNSSSSRRSLTASFVKSENSSPVTCLPVNVKNESVSSPAGVPGKSEPVHDLRKDSLSQSQLRNSIPLSSSRDPLPVFPAPGSSSSQGEGENQSSDFYLSSAKRLKHAADKETDRTIQFCKYLEAVLFFMLTGSAMEQEQANLHKSGKMGFMYGETLQLMKHIVPKFVNSRPSNREVPINDHKLLALCNRCQSLLMLRMSRMPLRVKEMRDLSKMIQTQAPEVPASPSATVTLPASVYAGMRKQLSLHAELAAVHDYWNQAEYLIERYPQVKAFFISLDQECRPLSLSSSFDELVHYVRTGLKILN